jgi:tripartite ATP-independent transporter DctP family solute receptor
MKKLLTVVTFLFLVLTFVGCSSTISNKNESASSETYKLKLAHTANPNHHYQTISERFAELVAERTDGKVIIDIYPADQLGGQADSVEGVMLGTQDMVLTSDGLLSNWVSDMGILNLPFLFENSDQVLEVLNGSPGVKLASQLDNHGAVILGWWQNGFRHITNSKHEILEPNDLKGIKIRVPEAEISIDVFRNMGASPTPVAFAELYTALQLGTVDAQETPTAHIVTQNLHEVQKYVSRTGHIYMSEPLLINKNLLESMPEEYQNVLISTAKELEVEHAELVNKLEEEEWRELEEKGMIISDVDREPFIESVQPVYEKYRQILNADIIDEILELIN